MTFDQWEYLLAGFGYTVLVFAIGFVVGVKALYSMLDK